MFNKFKTYADYVTFIPIMILMVPFDYVTWNLIDCMACIPITHNPFQKSLHYRSWKEVINSNWQNHICKVEELV